MLCKILAKEGVKLFTQQVGTTVAGVEGIRGRGLRLAGCCFLRCAKVVNSSVDTPKGKELALGSLGHEEHQGAFCLHIGLHV